MIPTELKKVLDKHQLWLKNEHGGAMADLRGANLRGAVLRMADLRVANLCGANLRGANLREANLREANLRMADLREADLRMADLREADLRMADLYMTDLRGANLHMADLRMANLRGADLREAYLDFASWPFCCSSFGAIADDRLIAQLIAHTVRLDVSKASQWGQDAVKALTPYANKFCAYREDVAKVALDAEGK
jgi:hypothetical protein